MLRFVLCAVAATASLIAQTPLKLQLVASGLVRPTFVASPTGDAQRLFVAEQPGRIRIVRNGVLQQQPFLDLSALGVVGFGGEAGLLGFALVTAENGHLRPQFADKWLPRALDPHMDRIGDIISMLICAALGWYAVGFVQSSADLGERGMAIPIKVWPIQLVLPWMFFSSAIRHAAFAIWPALRPEPKGESH